MTNMDLIFTHHNTLLDEGVVSRIPRHIAEQYNILLLHVSSKFIKVAVVDPSSSSNSHLMEYLHEKCGSQEIQFQSITKQDFKEALEFYYNYPVDLIEEAHSIIKKFNTGSSNKLIYFVNSILIDAIRCRASDIHFSPEEFCLRVRYRIDGRLKERFRLPLDLWASLNIRLKVMCNMGVGICLEPANGRFSLNVLDQDIDFRLSIHPILQGENMVLRILNKEKGLVPLTEIGFSQSQLEKVLKALRCREGLFIITGPTGAGKTTTLYSILQHLNSQEVNIMTLEQPIEYRLKGICQSEIRDEVGMTFSEGVRSVLRQDPDIILIGEIRDKDTAVMAIRASMTGHQVFTTLHTNDAHSVIERLQELNVPSHNIDSYLIGIIAQRLVRKICVHCRESYFPAEHEKYLLEIDEETLLYKGKGCANCNDTGYCGRIPLIDLIINEKDSVNSPTDGLIIPTHERKKGLWEHGRLEIVAGNTTFTEIVDTLNDTF